MSVSLLSVIAILLFCPYVLGHFRQGPQLATQAVCFSGGTRMGSRNPEGAAVEAQSAQSAGRGTRPEAVLKTEGQNRERNTPDGRADREPGKTVRAERLGHSSLVPTEISRLS